MKIFRVHVLWIVLVFMSLDVVSAQRLLLTNATIVDPADRTEKKGSIVIEGNTIQSVEEMVIEEFDGDVIDVEGKWIIPGLYDMHVHSYGNMGPNRSIGEFLMTPMVSRRMLYSGVTGFLDLFSVEDFIFTLRDTQRKDGMEGADIYAAGPILTATGGHGTEYGIPTRVVNNPEEVEKEIGELIAKKPDVIKLVYDNVPGRMPTVNLETMKAVVQESNKHDIPVVVHIGTWQDIRDVVEAGAHAVTHTPEEPLPDDIIPLMLEKGAAIIPTLCVQTEFLNLIQDSTLLESPLLTEMTSADLLKSYKDTSAFAPGFKRWLKAQERSREDLLNTIRALGEAGVPILVGTDAGNVGTFQGYSVHREMQLMVEAGLSPWNALESATTRAGAFLGISAGVSEGSVANLVVLNQSPLDDIGHTQDIHMVVYRGKVVDRPSMLSVGGGE